MISLAVMIYARQIWEETAKQLAKVYSERESQNIAYILLEDVFEIELSDIIANEKRGVSPVALADCIERLLDNEPIQYVTGVADFYGYKFRISSGALIPRPETEELVDLIVKENRLKKPRVFDVGVGSGCIAIALSLKLGGEVFGADVSQKALEIANLNASELAAEVIFFQTDILKNDLPENKLDILVSNPPYIPVSDKQSMHVNVLDYEPEIALFVPNSDPLLFYKRIAEIGRSSLKKRGRLYFEIHENFGDSISDLLNDLGYTEVHIHKDMQGKDRIACATNSTSK